MYNKVAALVFLLTLVPFMPSCGDGDQPNAAGLPLPVPSQKWVLAEDILEIPGLHSQGLATLPSPGTTDIAYTSRYTLDRLTDGKLVDFNFAFSPELTSLGFDHLGDPDGYGGRIYGPLEDNSDPVVNPNHRGFAVYDAQTLTLAAWTNDQGTPDVPADRDCAWAAVSPDGNWVVTGQWAPMQSVIVYRAGALLSGPTVQRETEIPMDATFNNVQGCDFDGPRVLVCASDDADAGRLVYAVILSGPLEEESLMRLTAHVEPLFPTPVPPRQCGEPHEVEGVDVNGDTLRVLVLGSCLLDAHLYRYERCEGECS